MVYELAHFIKEKFRFLWDTLEWCNATLFALTHGKQISKLDDVLRLVSTEYIFRTARVSDVGRLVEFYSEQPSESFKFFNPYKFDEKSIGKIIKNKSFISFVVFKDDILVGCFFLRCFINGKCFRGKIVHKDWQGRGIAKLMGIAMTKVSQELGLRMFGSISPNNFASMESAKASNTIKVHKILDNGYYYIEFLPKEE